ncbi:Serine decarboxylase, partial [Mucuna pruriens]
MEKNKPMAFVPATELLPRVVSGGRVSKKEEKKIQIQENNNSHTNLPTTNCTGETQPNLASLITQYVETLNQCSLRNLGYPTNQNFNYDALNPLFHFHLNNAGDPFQGSSFSLNSTPFEVSVLD